MSKRYHRGGTYQTRNPLAVHSPLRSIPLFKPAATVFGAAWQDGAVVTQRIVVVEPAPVPAPGPVDPARELANAEASLREQVRVYDFARKEIGEANATSTKAIISGGRVVVAAKPFTKERIRERKSAAFSMFNKRRGELARARRRVDAARAALSQPSLAVIEERAAVAAAVRASKQVPVVHHPIASIAAYAG